MEKKGCRGIQRVKREGEEGYMEEVKEGYRKRGKERVY